MTSTATRRRLACASLLVALQVGATVAPVAASPADCHGRSCADGAGKSEAGTRGRPADPGRPAEPGTPADPGTWASPPPTPSVPLPATPPAQPPVAPPAEPPALPPVPPVPPVPEPVPEPVAPDVPADGAPPAPAAPVARLDDPASAITRTTPGVAGGLPVDLPPQELLAQLPPQQALAAAQGRVMAARRLLAEAEADAAIVAEQVGESDPRGSGGSLPGTVRRDASARSAPGAAPGDTARSEPRPSPFSATSAQSDRRSYDSPTLLLLIIAGWLGASAVATAVVAALIRAGSGEGPGRLGRQHG